MIKNDNLKEEKEIIEIKTNKEENKEMNENENNKIEESNKKTEIFEQEIEFKLY